MVKRIGKTIEGLLTLPSISIEASELIDLLVDCVGNDFEIVAQNGNYVFESVQDIRNNLHLMKGNPHIVIGRKVKDRVVGLNIVFGVFESSIRIADETPEEYHEEYSHLADKISDHLDPYETFKFLQGVGMTITAILSLMFIVLVFSGSDIINADWYRDDGIFIYVLSLIPIVTLATLFVPFSSVKFNPRQSLFNQHKGEVVVGVVIGVIMVIVTSIGKWLLTNYTGTPPT